MTHVVRDKRKLHQILADPADPRTHLLLARRSTEFDGDTTRVLASTHAGSLRNVEHISLYNCKLDKLRGMSALAGAPLADLVLANNALTECVERATA
jgi:hypothetical protein